MNARLGWRLAVPVVLAASGVLFVTSAQTAHGTDLRTGGRTKLSDLVVEQEQRNARLAAQLARARGSVDSLTASLSLDPRLTSQVSALSEPAGLAAARGPGDPGLPRRRPALAPGAQRPSWVTLRRPGRPPAGPPGGRQRPLARRGRGRPGHGPADRLDERGAMRREHAHPPGRVYSPPFVVTAIGDRRRLRAGVGPRARGAAVQGVRREAGLRWSDRDLRVVHRAGLRRSC